MFNVMVDAKAQSTKLCSMEMGQEVKMQVLPFTAFKGNVMKFPILLCAKLRGMLALVDLAFHIERADEYAGCCSQINPMNMNIQNPSHLGEIFCKGCSVHKVPLELVRWVLTTYKSLTTFWSQV